jgi:hypothetical protein
VNVALFFGGHRKSFTAPTMTWSAGKDQNLGIVTPHSR